MAKRTFVGVSTTHNRIVVHPETHKPCGHVFSQVKVGSSYAGTFSIEKLDDGTIKLAEGENNYWLVVWGDNSADALNNKHVQKAVGQDTTIKICDTCG